MFKKKKKREQRYRLSSDIEIKEDEDAHTQWSKVDHRVNNLLF